MPYPRRKAFMSRKYTKIMTPPPSTPARESHIGSFFDAEANDWDTRQKAEGLPSSAKVQIQDILAEAPKSAIDVGSGTGTLLLELLENGVTKGVGVDLSPKMCHFAKLLAKEKGLEDRVEILNASFLEYTSTEPLEAVSLHRVLCCHPDREQMLNKSIELQPKIVSVTIPRDWLLVKWLLVAIFSIKDRIKPGYRPYVHSQRKVDAQMREEGYLVKNRTKKGIWITTAYVKSE